MESVTSSDISNTSNEVANENVKSEDKNSNEFIDYRKIKHKVPTKGGEHREIDYDELIRGYGESSESQKRFRESAEIEKKYKSHWEKIRNGDLSDILSHAPADKLMELVENIKSKKDAWEGLSEHEQARMIAEYERDQLRKEKDERTAVEKQKEIDRYNLEIADELDNEISSAIRELHKEDPTLHVTTELVHDIARLIRAQLNKTNDITKLDTKRATSIAVKRWRSNIESYLKTASPQALRNLIPRDLLEKIREEDVEKALSQVPKFGKRKVQEEEKKKAVKEKMSTSDFFNNLSNNWR